MSVIVPWADLVLLFGWLLAVFINLILLEKQFGGVKLAKHIIDYKKALFLYRSIYNYGVFFLNHH
jgi:hypothetical protein